MSTPFPTPTGPTVGYLTKRFPRLSETFILDEILGLEAAGVPLRLFSIADPGEGLTQPDVTRVASPVGYLHTGTGRLATARDYLRFARAHATLLRRDPRRWLAVAGHIAVARRHVSTLKHFLQAGALAADLERVGAGHVHAAFAHGPASVAHFVHLLTGTPFSFAAHAKDLYLSSPDILARKVAASEFVLVCSTSAADALTRIVAAHWDPAVRHHTDKIALAPHGVDTTRFTPPPATPPPATPPPAPGPLRVLAVGRLVPKKGYPVLLDALAELVSRGVSVQCRIAGGGALRGELAARATRLGLTGQVQFTGAATQQEIGEHYHWAEVFVQASVITADGDRDGIPNSVMEAMASGLAVVASSVAGIPEVVHDGQTGVLVPAGDPAVLAGALHRLAGDPARRAELGTHANRYAVERLSRRVCLEPVVRRLLAAIGEPAAGRLPTAAPTAAPAAAPAAEVA